LLFGGVVLKYISFILVLSIALIALLAPPASVQPNASVLQAPRIHVREGSSTNWSGYAVETNLSQPKNGAVNDVKGSWVVPAVTGPSSSAVYYSSIWVGIDGYSNRTVEQIGTEQDWNNGSPVYSAWYEMYPKWSQPISNTVHANDIMTAEVQYLNNQFALTLKDWGTTQGTQPVWTYTTNQKSGSAKRSSAEWIVEAPSSTGGILTLANFGTANLTNATFNSSNLAINASGWAYDAIDMVNSSGTTIIAKTSVLGADGKSFSVKYGSTNP
jgi:Peptidase A4 family